MRARRRTDGKRQPREHSSARGEPTRTSAGDDETLETPPLRLLTQVPPPGIHDPRALTYARSPFQHARARAPWRQRGERISSSADVAKRLLYTESRGAKHASPLEHQEARKQHKRVSLKP